MTVAAAMTTGSMLACGIDPCAPRPNRRICRLSPAEVMTPARPPMVPAGPTITCWPSTTPVSSAGWKTAISIRSEQADLQTVARGGDDSSATADGPGRPDHHVLAEHDARLFRRLEDRHQHPIGTGGSADCRPRR